MNKLKIGLLAFTLAMAPIAASAAGNWADWPGIGQTSYCAAIVGSSNVQGGQTGQGTGGAAAIGTNGVYCAQTVPAGPALFTGTEVLPLDLYSFGTVTGVPTTSALASIVQLGQGPMVDQTTVGTTQTIPNNTPFFFLDGAQSSGLTVTMPALAVEGQIQRVVCEAATVGTLTVAANTSVVTQVLKGNPNTACVAGVGYAWRYQGSNLTWYRF
jgi:hypothetical protein